MDSKRHPDDDHQPTTTTYLLYKQTILWRPYRAISIDDYDLSPLIDIHIHFNYPVFNLFRMMDTAIVLGEENLAYAIGCGGNSFIFDL